jgi:hypothetical protein
MARARSPEYPSISLKEAIDRVKMVYDKDYQNRLPKKVIAEHMGYKGLSGASLPILSALTKYGLLEGRGDETRVSDLAVALIAHAPGTPERMDALKNAAAFPDLFAELDERFPDSKASDQAIRSYLLTRKFIPGAADVAVRAYRDTKALVEAESAGYYGGEAEQESAVTPQVQMPLEERTVLHRSGSVIRPPAPGTLQEVFNLDEGPVTLAFPSELSPESYEELKAQLELFLRRAQRRAQLRSDLGPMPDRLHDRENRRNVAERLASTFAENDEIPPVGNMEKVGGVLQPKRTK